MGKASINFCANGGVDFQRFFPTREEAIAHLRAGGHEPPAQPEPDGWERWVDPAVRPTRGTWDEFANLSPAGAS